MKGDPLKLLKEGVQPPKPWSKVVTCNFYREESKAFCSAVFEVEKADLIKSEISDQDDRTSYHYYHVHCPTCKGKVDIPELFEQQKWRQL